MGGRPGKKGVAAEEMRGSKKQEERVKDEGENTDDS